MSEAPEVEVQVEVESSPEPVQEESAPTVVVVEDSGNGGEGAVQAATVEAAIDQAGDIARLEAAIAVLAEGQASLLARLENTELTADVAIDVAQEAAAEAAEAKEGEQEPAEDDVAPDNMHPWFKERGRK